MNANVGARTFFCLSFLIFLLVLSGHPAKAQQSVQFTLYIDQNSITLYVADDGDVSLLGLMLQGGDDLPYSLADFPAFVNLPLDTMPSPFCLRLEIDTGGRRLLPDPCANIQLYLQQVTAEDFFWVDQIDRFVLPITILGGVENSTCGETELSCTVSFTPRTRSDSANDTPIFVSPEEVSGMVFVVGGCFMMGSSDAQLNAVVAQYNIPREWLTNELPQHQVCLDSFYIDQYEVSGAEYDGSGDQRPRVNVSWNEANRYCQSLGKRLPTEAEWEYAARGADSLIYPWGDDFSAIRAVYRDNSGGGRAAIGQYRSGQSWVGAYDLSGNVKEWTGSLFQPYPYRADDGRENPTAAGDRVIRGGAYYDPPYILRAAGRNWADPSTRDVAIGFRCAQDVTI